MKRFNLRLSREVDKIHSAMERTKALPNTPLKLRKLLVLRKKLATLHQRIRV